MSRLTGNQNQKWGRYTWYCVVNLDSGTFQMAWFSSFDGHIRPGKYHWVLLPFASISVLWSQIWMVILEYWKIYIQTQSSNSCPKSRDKHLLFKNAWKGIIDGIREFYKILQETSILNLNIEIQLIKSILRNQIFQCGHILSLQSSSFAVKFVWKYDG